MLPSGFPLPVTKPPDQIAIESSLLLGDSALHENLQAIRRAADRIFAARPISWYTDHGITHSERVIKKIIDIVNILPEKHRLSKDEWFTLLASCYLHDIGMSYLKIAKKTYPYDEKDFEVIRTRHPQASAQLILENAYYLEDPKQVIPLEIDSDYAKAVSLVSKAHGIDFFSETLPELDKLKSIHSDAEFRGPLLAALLLMGDELDLDSRRSKHLITPLAEWADYPPESILHIYRHHYIRAANVRHFRGFGQIYLEMEFPAESEDYAMEMFLWIVHKLRKQCRLTRDIFVDYGLVWAPQILVHWSADDPGRRPLPPEARPLLREITTKRRVVNRETLGRVLQGYAQGEFDDSHAVLIHGNGVSDHLFVAQWFESFCRAQGDKLSWGSLDFASESPYHKDAIIKTIEKLQKTGNRAICILHNLQEADKLVREWVEGKGPAHLLSREGTLPVLLVCFSDIYLAAGEENLFCVEKLGPFLPGEVQTHLEGKLGYPEHEARDLLITSHPGSQPPGVIAFNMQSLEANWYKIQ